MFLLFALFIETQNPVSQNLLKENQNVIFKDASHKRKSSLPSIQDRDKFLIDNGHKKEMSSMDELDKDILYWKLHQ